MYIYLSIQETHLVVVACDPPAVNKTSFLQKSCLVYAAQLRNRFYAQKTTSEGSGEIIYEGMVSGLLSGVFFKPSSIIFTRSANNSDQTVHVYLYTAKSLVLTKHCSVFLWSQSIESNTETVLQLVK